MQVQSLIYPDVGVPMGLVNLRNTYFMNSILQVLLHSPPAVMIIRSHTQCTKPEYIKCDLYNQLYFKVLGKHSALPVACKTWKKLCTMLPVV